MLAVRYAVLAKSVWLMIGFVGHVIGLGDRHGSNILVDQLTWGALHIDFGDVGCSLT